MTCIRYICIQNNSLSEAVLISSMLTDNNFLIGDAATLNHR